MNNQTYHKIFFRNSSNMKEIQDESVALVITSPPYPMIEMWDEIFSSQNSNIKLALESEDGLKAFELMHNILDTIWKEVYRILIPGGIACINIGDATRSIGSNFQLYPSHARIINSFTKIGFQSLPEILWRKKTNSPNKFMGSGMLPPNAYVTLEHEYILIFRKGLKREIKDKTKKEIRKKSAFFWEERNKWFSDIWELKGVTQDINLGDSRERSGAFPFKLAFRLINMYSIKNDTIVDPFLGTGTTILAAIASERNSIGYEIDEKLKKIIIDNIKSNKSNINDFIYKRIDAHDKYIKKRVLDKGDTKYDNTYHNFPVITKQETQLEINSVKSIDLEHKNEIKVMYEKN